MDAVTVGKKIKEVTNSYTKVSDEELGQKYLGKYGWVMGINDSNTIKQSQPSGQLTQNYNGLGGIDLAQMLLGMKAPVTQGPGGSYSHQGVTAWDYGVGSGTPLKATTDVQAEYLPNQGIYGNRMKVTLANGKKYFISHLSSGQSGTYKAGQEYARSGNTGKSSGAHVEIAPI